MSSQQYDWFRCEHEKGSKDWAVGVVGDAVHVRYGATGRTMQLRTIPRRMFSNPVDEKDRRIAEKLAKGYVRMGLATMQGNRLAPVVTGPELHWANPVPINKRSFMEVCETCCDALSKLNDGSDVVAHGNGIRMRWPQGTWRFGFDQAGGLRGDGTAAGKVAPASGVLPVLFLLTVEKAFPGAIVFADSKGGRVKPLPVREDKYLGEVREDFARTVTRAIALGLLPGPTNFQSKAGDQRTSLWF